MHYEVIISEAGVSLRSDGVELRFFRGNTALEDAITQTVECIHALEGDLDTVPDPAEVMSAI